MSSEHQLGDAPIEQAYVDKMNRVARALDLIFNEGKTGEAREVGYVLLVFNFGEGKDDRCNYISNANRSDVVRLMKEQIKRFEGTYEDPPHASGK